MANPNYSDPNSFDLSGMGGAPDAQGQQPQKPPTYQNIPGFEESRLNNPQDNDPKTIWGRYVASKGGKVTADDVRAFVGGDSRWEINPQSGSNDPQIRVKQDILNSWKPGQSTWQDVIRDSGGANAGQFENAAGTGDGYAQSSSNPGGFGQGTGVAGALGGMATAGVGTVPNAMGGYQDPRANQLYSMLMGRAQQGLNVSGKDPIIASQVNSYGAQQQRGVRDYLAAEAEKQGPMGNLGSERRLANEHAAQATGGLQASLMQNELNAKRTEIQNALSQAGAQLSDQQRMGLQDKLAMIDAGLRQQGINLQDKFGTLDANARQQTINSGNDQFAAQLGFNQADRSNYWDWLRSGGSF